MDDLQEKSEILSKQWLSLNLQERCVNQKENHPSDRADVTRNLLSQIEYARAINIISSACSAKLLLHQHDEYGKVIDAPGDMDGLDNFAESTLSLLEGRRNESKHWITNLSIEKSGEMECIQKFIASTKASRTQFLGNMTADTSLNLTKNTKKYDVSGIANVKPEQAHAKQEPIEAKASLNRPGTSGFGNAAREGTALHRPPQFKAGNPVQGNVGACATQPSSNRFSFKTTGGNNKNPTQPSFDTGDSRKALFGGTSNNTRVPPLAGHPNNASNPNTGQSNWSGQSRERNIRYPNPAPPNTGNNSTYKRPDGNNVPGGKRGRENNYEEEEDDVRPGPGFFKSAREQLAIDNQKKNKGRGGYSGGDRSVSNSAYGTHKKSLGTRRGPNSKFVPPIMNKDDDDGGSLVKKAGPNKTPSVGANGEPVDERLKNIDDKMIETIMNEVMDKGTPITWDDIAGLEFAKKTIKEIVVWPMLRPDIFTGLRGPPKGLLLFGPPGTGKTLIGKCIASQSKSTFFSISASSLTSKWVGEGEKMVRALFAVARCEQPAVIFIDEIDSLLSQRSDGEHEASRRIKTEFLVQLDGATTGDDDRILVVGATNRPQELDEAARRRFVKRLYIPLPEDVARKQIVINLMSQQASSLTDQQQAHSLTDQDLLTICQMSDGYSGADMANLCKEAAMGPIRSLAFDDIGNIEADQVRPIVIADFMDAFKQVRASVSDKDLDLYLDWNKQYGSFGE